MDTEEIRQGFLCPVCLTDLGDIQQLSDHFQTNHTQSDIPLDFSDQIKDFVGRAKQKFSVLDSRNSIDGHSGQSSSNWSPPTVQEIEFERELVAWQTDGDAPTCRTCNERFGLTRRKHHCRLCGNVICKQCSRFLTFLIARKLVHPVGYSTNAGASSEESSCTTRRASLTTQFAQKNPVAFRRAERLLNVAGNALKRDKSEISLASFINQNGDEHVRVCGECEGLLLRRDAAIDSRQSPPIVVQMYEQLTSLMDQAANQFPIFNRITDSLNKGESVYTILDAKEIKLKLMRLQEQIDVISRKIQSYGQASASQVCAADGEPPKSKVSPREQLLQNNIRMHAVAFLKDMILFMPVVPDEKHYLQLQMLYKQRITDNINTDRINALRTAQCAVALPASNGSQTMSQQQRVPPPKYSAAAVDDGWVADRHEPVTAAFSMNPFDEPEDPLLEQIHMVKGYLRQAAAAGRSEEVQILEHNLKELQLEMQHRQTTVD